MYDTLPGAGEILSQQAARQNCDGGQNPGSRGETANETWHGASLTQKVAPQAWQHRIKLAHFMTYSRLALRITDHAP
jgi:hypothetical protein